MAVRVVLQIGDPRLKAENKEVEDFNNPLIKRIIKDLTDTMRKNGLVGIAASQIGQNYKIFVTEPRKTKTRKVSQIDKLRIYINPRIVYFSKEENIIYEGCGSVANGELFAPVKRPKEIKVEAYDLDRKKFSLKCDGLLARVIQHEYDHLFGIEFTEKIMDYRKIMSQKHYAKTVRNSKEQIEACLMKIKEYLEI